MSVLARTVAALARTGWGWSADELPDLVTAAGWVWRAPSEGTVSCRFDADPGNAGAFLFGAEVTALYLSLAERDEAAGPEAVLARRDGFRAAVDEVTELLGPPPARCPGPDPSAGWRVAAGVLEIVDRPGVLDLWLRPVPRRVPPSPVAPAADGTALPVGLAAAAASLPAGAVVTLLDGRGGVWAELRQTDGALTVVAGDDETVLVWPAAGTAYREWAAGLADRWGDEAGELSYRSDFPVPHLPLPRA
ncbi:DUF6301 family protein [Actinoplanes flavus]|uniref:Uncharacterized protein n=1 Tax=Actinoplanes flavus TaxID=2820290 RepID=A0ABS3UKY8_9ACTN|nr:DUF6301 family protein [Actinoplanes flavus]MBO3738408.1 hypothetical protein [Actinoplanes flavus]